MNSKKYICTYFDFNFLPRGLALYSSIKRYHNNFMLYALVFDEESYEYLLNKKLENLIPISFKEYDDYYKTSKEKFDDAKQYYFSATPNLCLYLLEKFKEIDILLYLDADVYLFNSLNTLYDEFGNSSIGICPHRLHPILRFLSKDHGRFNVGVNLFRNSDESRRCLADWKVECDGWYKCKSGYHLEYFSNQIFLNDWIGKYKEIKVIENIGVDVAPWNAANYNFSFQSNEFLVNGKPIIIYHFSALKRIAHDKWNGNTIIYYASIKGSLLELYRKYINEIENYNLMTESYAEIKLSKNIGKRLFYSIMRVFLNETITIRK